MFVFEVFLKLFDAVRSYIYFMKNTIKALTNSIKTVK